MPAEEREARCEQPEVGTALPGASRPGSVPVVSGREEGKRGAERSLARSSGSCSGGGSGGGVGGPRFIIKVLRKRM